MKSRKGPGLAIILGSGKGSYDEDDEYPPSSKGRMSDYDDATDALADLLRVEDGDKEDFREFLRAVITSCK